MDGIERHSALIHALSADLKPVRQALSPLMLSAIFAAVAVAVGALVTVLTNFPHLVPGPEEGFAVWLPVIGAVLTAICCTFAAFQTGLPDRSPWWALLPAPAAALWLGAEIYHCFWAAPGGPVWGDDLAEALKCVRCILMGAAPLALLALLLLRTLNPLEPGVAALLSGIAAAAAGAAILAVAHPHEPALLDLILHGVTVAAVIVLTLGVGRRVLAR